MGDYHKAGLLIVREGCVLLCRKRHGTRLLILPGGCLEPGESAEACLRREAREELGEVELRGIEFLGEFSDAAAGDTSRRVYIALYRAELVGAPQPCSEIAELVWFGEHDDRGLLAPSLVNKILPDLEQRRLLPWSVP